MVFKTEDEGLYLAQHQYWLEMMKHAIQSEKNLAQQETSQQGATA